VRQIRGIFCWPVKTQISDDAVFAAKAFAFLSLFKRKKLQKEGESFWSLFRTCYKLMILELGFGSESFSGTKFQA
jgi:hypothetical protein